MSTAQTSPLPTLANYQMRLSSYEGPLDVLLRLIERHQLAITDVSLVQVTGQFLRFVNSMEEAPAEVIADFTAMGTRLTLLKSRSLLPRPSNVEEDGEPDPSDLVRQLQAYKRLKDAARVLGERRDSGLASFGPNGSGPVARPSRMAPPRLAHYEPTVLIRSLRRRLSTIPHAMQTIRQRRMVSLRDMIDRVLDLATSAPRIRFSRVMNEYQTRTEMATAFLAVLVLIRRRSMDAEQDGLFGEIELTRVHDLDAREFDDAEPEFLN
jgi:segregation and condensation protein A